MYVAVLVTMKNVKQIQEKTEKYKNLLNAVFCLQNFTFEPLHEKTNKMAYAPVDDSDQPGHPPSLVRVFTVRSMGS